MNGYNRCGGCQAPMVQQPMIYAVPTMQQPNVSKNGNGEYARKNM